MTQSIIDSGKRWLLAACLGLATISSPAVAASAGSDNAGNYTALTFIDGANEGTGFGAWSFGLGAGAQVTVEDSTLATANINSTNDLSFMVYGGTGGTYADATRPFGSALNAGDTFSCVMAYNWNGGIRGLAINRAGGELMYIQYRGGDELAYGFSGGPDTVIDTTYSATASVTVVIEQLAGNALDVTITRNDGFTTNFVSGALAGPATGVKFYNGGHDGDNLNYALFVNNLDIEESLTPTLAISGQDAMAAGMTNLITLTRGGSLVDPATIYLSSSDEFIAAVPASITFNAGEAVTNFTIEGLAFGVVSVVATSDVYADVLIDVAVYDEGYDDSSYYPPGQFEDAGNSGLGFQPWIFIGNDGPGEGFTNFAGAFIGDSTVSGGGNVNASSGDAFGIYANRVGTGGDAPSFNAIRPFELPLDPGFAMSLQFGVNFRNGAKGVNVQNSGTWLFEVAVIGDDYVYINHTDGGVPVSLGWEYAADTAIGLEMIRVSPTMYDITITRSGSTPETASLGLVDLGDLPPNEARFYVFNTEGGGENNLYFNRLALYSGYQLPAVTVDGFDGMIVGQTNVFTATRSGPTDVEMVVDLVSSDDAIVGVATQIVFGIGEDIVGFEVVGVSTGEATIASVDSLSFIGFSYSVDVVDIAYDDTTYYPPETFDGGANGGQGFEPWIITGNNGEFEGYTNFVGTFIGSSVGSAGDVDSSEVSAFGLYANGTGVDAEAPLAEVIRPFAAELGIGESMQVEIGVNFRNGSKGLMFQNGGTWLFEVGVFGDDYWYNVRDAGDNPVSLGWAYADDSAITVVISRVGATSYNVKLVRSGSAPEELTIGNVTLSQAPDRVRFYVFDTDNGEVQNNLYVNRLAIYTGTIGDDTTDGIPNSWWQQYSIDPIDRVAGNDIDDDDSTNLDEYIADTNPTNGASFFGFVTSIRGGNVINLQTAPTTNSRVYGIWWTTNLLAAPQTWTALGATTPGTGSPVTLSVTSDVPVRFYRTGVALP